MALTDLITILTIPLPFFFLGALINYYHDLKR